MRIRHTGIQYDDPARSTPGYLLVRPVESDTSFLLGPDGTVAHEWRTTTGMTNWCYLLPNGNLFSNERCENRRCRWYAEDSPEIIALGQSTAL